MIIVCRNKVWRGIVSIAERVLSEAKDRNLPVVLYIDKDKDYDFLKFDPDQLFDLNDWNWRGKPPEKFYHIPARFGTMLEDSKVAKLEDYGFIVEGGG